MDQLHYETQVDATSIRLLHISFPDGADASISVSRHMLNDVPSYYALSYTWGASLHSDAEYTENDKVPIQVDGKLVKIFPNLYHALLQCHKSYAGVWLWVDAICIEQSCFPEREAQVGIMDQIYQNATKVIVWLGQEKQDSQIGLNLVKLYARVAIREISRFFESRQFGAVNLTQSDSLRNFGLPGLNPGDAKALIGVYEARWFHRIWILQEVALAREVQVHWGNASVSWDELGMTATFIQLSSISAGLSFLFSGNFHRIQDIDSTVQGILSTMRIQLVREWCKGGDSPLKTALEATEVAPGLFGHGVGHYLLRLLFWTRVSFQATKQRDGVYGFLGILNHMCRDQQTPRGLQPDYTTPVPALMQRFTEALLQEIGSLHVLSLVCDPTLREVPGTPSWVPDLSPSAAANPILGPCLKCTVERDLLFHASTKCIDTEVASRSFSVEANKLHVRGQRVGSVYMKGEELEEALNGEINGWGEIMLAMEPIYEPTRQTRGDAFRRMIIMDTDETNRPAAFSSLFKLQHVILWIVFNSVQQKREEDSETGVKAGIDVYLNTQSAVFRAAREVEDCVFPAREAVEEKIKNTKPLLGNLENPTEDTEKKEEWLEYLGAEAFGGVGVFFLQAMGYRRPFLLDNKYIGCGPKSTEEGDEVWVLMGSRTPLVLRRTEIDGEYTLIGEAYVHGIMYGEFMDDQRPWLSLSLV